MTLRTEPVGSLPRPTRLQSALIDYDAGLIGRDQVEREQDLAVADTLERFAATGSPLITDGEQRVSSFATYPFAETLGGAELGENLALDGQYFAIFEDGHHRQLPRLTAGPFAYRSYAASNVIAARPLTELPLKQAVIAPSLLSLLYPLDGQIDGYRRDEFLGDLVDECELDIRRTFAAGASRVSIDFTEGRLALRGDARNPWTGRKLLGDFIELNNRVFERFTASERANIGLHTCPGSDLDSAHSADVDYAQLLPELFQLDAGYFLVQLASEPDRERVYELIGRTLRPSAGGVAQQVLIGVTDPKQPRVESVDEVRAQIVSAARYVPAERLGSTDDCGFSPFSIDDKPRHGSPDAARDIAFAKITARVEGTRLAAEELGGSVTWAGGL
ncbi:cobalamin-independent methionine synthase II family protein [Klugiella xanthotipulae]|uniref:Methionine synthase II (Cobalamin-independent) n=1 Tax=Klugiella xanthotipulae TaxID=244735 RepID=A0A543HXR9_9MICO|nr:hypothetical protein [Klugiella xanthotipulae]TQM63137.1 methionine synthase II (cobalamin-independent) [Klugiella xanthotipulae]